MESMVKKVSRLYTNEQLQLLEEAVYKLGEANSIFSDVLTSLIKSGSSTESIQLIANAVEETSTVMESPAFTWMFAEL